jgi:hypothetical protein
MTCGVAAASVATAGVPHAVRTIDAMISRDRTYMSFFMVSFLLYLGLD